jgi:hypothetical protein
MREGQSVAMKQTPKHENDIGGNVEQPLDLKPSANVKGASYDPDTQKLTVKLNGGTYVYDGVSADKAQAFADAESHGSFLHMQIKGQHTYTKIG